MPVFKRDGTEIAPTGAQITDLVTPAAAGADVDMALHAPSVNSAPPTRHTKRAPAVSAAISSINSHLLSKKSARAWKDGLKVASKGSLRKPV